MSHRLTLGKDQRRPSLADASREAIGRLTAARILLCEDLNLDQRDLAAWVQTVAEEQVTEALRLLMNADGVEVQKDKTE
jgi:hypothetical protein